MLNHLRELLKQKRFLVLFASLLLVVAGVFLFLNLRKKWFPREAYEEVYRLVPEKISQSAAIPIRLPTGTDKSYGEKHIKFNPEIKGQWLTVKENKQFSFSQFFSVSAATQKKSNIIYFKPKNDLKLNRYYEVTLTMADGGTIAEDFLVVENPKIVAIFPAAGSETPEDSEITIVFNRPMVPLTTLGYLEEKEVPVEITPATEGRFKWITTRNLQFIPKERLIRSSNYEVKIKAGLVSMDGLTVDAATNSFITRKLRYVNLTQDTIIYDQPLSIYFNQPVDLEKTKGEIVLKDETTGREMPFIAEYLKKKNDKSDENIQDNAVGIKQPTGFFAKVRHFFTKPFSKNVASLNPLELIKKESDQLDKSVIQIYNQKDQFGREKLWDFSHNYSLTIRKAFPLEGNIILDESRQTNASVTGIIRQVTADSKRTTDAGPDFFDPQGNLFISFYEEVTLKKSVLSIPKLKTIAYGEKCQEDGQFYYGTNCPMVEDKKTLKISFKNEEIAIGEILEINLEKIVNNEGLVINKEPIKQFVKVYPPFKILSSSPEDNSSGASVDTLILCTNSPLLVPEKKDYKAHLVSDLDYEVSYWYASYRVEYDYPGRKCNVGEFQTNIVYGLIPEAAYSLELRLEDVFGQKFSHRLRFTTGPMPSRNLVFYHFQSQYSVTSPVKTKLTYAVQNMEYVDMEICQLEPLAFLRNLENKPDYFQPTSTTNCQKTSKNRIELPRKYWGKNYFKVNLKDYFPDLLGHYILTFSNPNYRSSYWDGKQNKEVERPAFERTYLTITNLAVTEKRIQPELDPYGFDQEEQAISAKQMAGLENLYWVTDLSTMTSTPGAQVVLYQGTALKPAGTFTTNFEGIALTKIVSDLKGIIVSKSGDSTVIPVWESNLNWTQTAYSAKKIYLYTDKPIYRPSQQVFIKGIYRLGYDGNYEIYQDKKLRLTVHNSRNEEIFNQQLGVSDFGTINTNLILDRSAPLGMYRICLDSSYECSYFDVQEYEGAAFEVKVTSDKEEYISKDIANLTVNANYYFGVPLEGGEVTYTVSSQNYYFDRYSDSYFNFDAGVYYWSFYPYGEKFILQGKTSLTNGQAKISQALDLEKLFTNDDERRSKIIVFDITVRNPQGQAISSQKSFIVHAGEFYFGLTADKSFLAKDETTNLKIKSVDTKGKEVQVKNVDLNLYRVHWDYLKRQEATGGFSYKWEKKRELISHYNFNTDNNGNYIQPLKISEEGEYEVEASSRDSRNNLVRSTDYLYVYGEGTVDIRPTQNTELELVAEKTNLDVGEEGTIIIKSPYQEAKALISIERGKVFDYQIKEIQGNLTKFSFKAVEDYLPNVYVSVLLQSAEPEIKFGQVQFNINTKTEELNVVAKPNKTHYLPGEEVSLDITVKDSRGVPVAAELSVAVTDLSVLALKGNPKKNPVVFFYAGFPLTVTTASNIKNILVETEIPTKGGGGMALETTPLAKRVRGVFKETAFWQAVVRTDDQGRAQVKFTLPDNLTTWQTEALGLTKDTKLGINYQEFITRKDLMVVPLKPRFVVPGDVFSIGAKIFNQTNENQKLTVNFNSATLVLKEKNSQKQTSIRAGQTETVYFKVQAPNQLETGEHQFSLSAKSEKVEDTVLQYISITPNTTYETVATANYTPEKVSREYVFLPDNVVKDKGSLSINSSATLAVFLSDSLNYLLQYPYGCTEQITSRLNAIAIVKRGLNLPNLAEKFQLKKIKAEGKEYTIEEIVEIGLAKIYNNQRYDGGFALWEENGVSNFYATLSAVETLHNLSLAGFTINQNALDKAATYLYQQITTNYNLYNSYQSKDNIILTSYILFQLPNVSGKEDLKQKIIEIAKNDLFINDQISNTSLAYLAIIMRSGFDEALKEKIFNTLDNRIDIDSRGAFLESNENILWYYYETPVKNTALYLKALSLNQRESAVLDKVVRWLLNSREKDGAWGSTNNTLSVVDALTDFLNWKRETESSFTLETSLNKQSLGSYQFNPTTILDQFKKEIPLKELELNQNNVVELVKENKNNLPNNFYYDLSLKYYLPAEKIPPRDEGFSITRELFRLDDKENKNPAKEAAVGDILRVHLAITVPTSRNFVAVEDYIPAGTEIVNLDLSTEQKSLRLQEKEITGREFYAQIKELHDDRAFLFTQYLSAGVYEFDYYVRALSPGTFTHLPAIVYEMYFPENFGRTSGGYFTVK